MEGKSPIDITPTQRDIFDIIWNPTQKDISNVMLLVLSHGPGIILPFFLNYVFQTHLWMYLYIACLFCVFIARVVMAIRFEINKSDDLKKSHKRLSKENRKKFIRTAFISMPISFAVPMAFFWIIYLVGRRNGFHEMSITGITFIIGVFLLFFPYALWVSYNKLLESQDKE